MKVLVLGGTRFFGVHTVNELLKNGHEVTIATRGNTPDNFGSSVSRLILDRTDEESMRKALAGLHFDTVIDKIGYCSNDIKYAMNTVDCDRYIYMSTTAVYDPKHMDTKEDEFDGLAGDLIWCSRPDFSYSEVKRHAEYALWQKYSDRNWLAVRYPFVIGEDDYTKRLLFYIEHTMNSTPMYIDNIDRQMGFIFSEEAGRFIAYLAEKDITGAINGCSKGTVSLREIIEYTEKKTGKKAVLSDDGDAAPYNGEVEYSINTDKATAAGFEFSDIRPGIFDLADKYIEIIKAAR